MTDIQPTRIEPTLERAHPVGSGTQRIYRFDNNLGASVIQNFIGSLPVSRGAESGRWELAVLRFTGEGIDPEGANWELTYDTPITDDVIGHLDDEEVQAILALIRELKGDEPIRVEATLGEPLALTSGEESAR